MEPNHPAAAAPEVPDPEISLCTPGVFILIDKRCYKIRKNEIRKGKAYLELNLVKNSKKSFFKNINNQRKTMENVHPSTSKITMYGLFCPGLGMD